MKPILYKTDKNGTKYWADYTCNRCGGAGGADQWNYTGWTCYKCGGTGRLDKPITYKEYTPEYQAKLDERRRKREAKKEAERVEYFKSHFMELIAKEGFNEEGKLYVVIGNTYDIKEELKEAGAKYKPFIRWYFTDKQDKYPTIELDYNECLVVNNEYCTVRWIDGWEIDKLIKAKVPTDESTSDYIGEIKQRIALECVFTKRFSFERKSFRGYGTDTVDINQFTDDNGNVLIWKTTSYFREHEGARVKLTGTVKEHSDYNGVKQTVLERCKVELA